MEEAIPMQMPESMSLLDSWNRVQVAIPASCSQMCLSEAFIVKETQQAPSQKVFLSLPRAQPLQWTVVPNC